MTNQQANGAKMAGIFTLNMKRTRLFLLAIFLAVPVARSVAQALPASSLQNPFDSSGASARAVGLGGAFVGVADDSSAIFFNPAGLVSLEVANVAAHHEVGLAGISQDILVAGLPGDGFGLGFSGQFINYGDFEGRNPDGTLSTISNAFQAGLGLGGAVRLFKGFSIGALVRGTLQQLASSSYMLFNADAGVLYSLPQGWSFGASYSNFGTASGNAVASSIIRAGVSKTISGQGSLRGLVAAAYSYEPQFGSEVQFGAEASLQSKYFIRAGYQWNLQESGLNGLQGLSAGAGIVFEGIHLDYSFVPFGDLGNTHRVSLAYNFPTAVKPAPAATPVQPVTAQPAVQELPNTVLPPVTQAPAQVQPEPMTSPAGTETGDSLTVHFDLPSEDVTRGEALEKEKRWKEAADAYRQAIQANRLNSQAWWHLGNLYYRAGQKPYAIQCYEQLLELKPDNKTLGDWLEKYKGTAIPGKP